MVLAFLPARQSLTNVLMNWDASWYRDIATLGYSWNPHSTAPQNPNFFPLFPLFERIGHALTGLSISSVAIGSSIVFQAGAAALLAVIARRHGASDRQALLWVTLFLLSPPAVFDVMGYYSALFCLLSFLALFFAQRGQLWLVALVLGLASGTNPVGIAFAGGFVMWSLIGASSRSVTWRSLRVLVGQALLSISGLLGYALFLLVRFGDPLAFYQATKAWSPTVPASTIFIRIVTFEPVRASFTQWAAVPYGWNTSFLIDAFAALAVVALIVALAVTDGGFKVLGLWLVVCAFVLVQVQTARWGSEIATTRYLLPICFGAGAVAPVRRFLTRPGVFTVTALVLLVGTAVFVQHLVTGQWID
ncbi:MAG: mannosyltransferase family protein [Acidimicrobiales bacterium]